MGISFLCPRNMSLTPDACYFGLLEGQEEDIKPQAAVVRRNLFGPVDHQQLQQDFQRLFCMNVEIAKQRWNFDFQRDQPVPGCIEWEELQCQDVPVFYHSCVVRPGMAKQTTVEACSSPAMATEKYLELRTRGTLRGTKSEKRMAALLGVKRTQANITDFFRVTKRRFPDHKASSGQ
ncbi:cyclin-dependent kinase inhibitor 1-like isoform X1 [Sinocyclocheilus anshuiensis]|nr:PREDICTED: cyclin-dependent kinase inhibitor 1-like isoform X1 [Sinocyclocheilus anshuiensis]